ncbi:UNVERIFIED_CONTAM: hypothetical protein FKN15_049526 [Acipenser sinensis]
MAATLSSDSLASTADASVSFYPVPEGKQRGYLPRRLAFSVRALQQFLDRWSKGMVREGTRKREYKCWLKPQSMMDSICDINRHTYSDTEFEFNGNVYEHSETDEENDIHDSKEALGKLYRTRKRKITGEGLFDCGAMFMALVRSRDKLEHAHMESAGDMTAFVDQWALGGVL